MIPVWEIGVDIVVGPARGNGREGKGRGRELVCGVMARRIPVIRR